MEEREEEREGDLTVVMVAAVLPLPLSERRRRVCHRDCVASSLARDVSG